jgi:serine/threonine protein kinase
VTLRYEKVLPHVCVLRVSASLGSINIKPCSPNPTSTNQPPTVTQRPPTHPPTIIIIMMKGANVLVSNDGTVKLADFGAAKRINNAAKQVRKTRGVNELLVGVLLKVDETLIDDL